MPLTAVPDLAFSQKMLGDGLAISELSSDIVCAPAAGVLTMVFPTNHAFGLQTTAGVDILVHIGINTVELNGAGFERLVEPGQSVSAGQPIIRLARQKILDAGFSLITPVVFTTAGQSKDLQTKCQPGTKVTAGKDIILSYKKN